MLVVGDTLFILVGNVRYRLTTMRLPRPNESRERKKKKRRNAFVRRRDVWQTRDGERLRNRNNENWKSKGGAKKKRNRWKKNARGDFKKILLLRI
jgi:hypothetical protein